MGDLPVECDAERILLMTAGLADLLEVTVSRGERDRATTMEKMTGTRFLAARRLTRAIFSKLLGINPDQIDLAVDENGKPFLPGKDFHLSIAHSGETVAVAISRSHVGLDLETERPVDGHALATRFFSPEEAVFLRDNPDPSLFFRFWTCREAAVKADGRGLSKLLGQIRVSTEGGSSDAGIGVTIGGERWTAHHWPDRDRLHLALAFRETPSLISWCDLRGGVTL